VEGDTRDGNRQGGGIESRRRPARPQPIADIDERRERDRRKYNERQQELTRPAPAPAQMAAALLADMNRSHGWRRPCGSVAGHESLIIRRAYVLALALGSPSSASTAQINP